MADCPRCGSSHADGVPHECGRSDIVGLGPIRLPPLQGFQFEGRLPNGRPWTVRRKQDDAVLLMIGMNNHEFYDLGRADALRLGAALIGAALLENGDDDGN